MSQHAVYWVDAFANELPGGAAAVVVLDADDLDPALMQRVANEFDVGETSFLMRPHDPKRAHARARIFTPVEERPYAGVPVLAMAFALTDAGRVPLGEDLTEVRLELAAGLVCAAVARDADGRSEIALTSLPPVFDAPIDPALVLPSLGLAPDRTADGAPVQVVSTGTRQLLICLQTIDDVTSVQLSSGALAALREAHDFASLRVFCLGGYTPVGDCFGRHFFAGKHGVNEDPFTGSSAGSMGAYLWHHNMFSGERIIAEQGHDLDRPGRATLEPVGEPSALAGVRVRGAVNALLRGTLSL
jgi:PhzF family phenazine biosynthesis protein